MTARSPLFIDSVHLIGLFVEKDQWRAAALAAEHESEGRPRYTSDGVFQEFLAHVARREPDARHGAAEIVRQMRLDSGITVVRHSDRLMEAALDLCDGEFRYTTLSLQDCVAIQVMRAFGISEILSIDQEFALAGLTPLMRRYA